MRDIVIAMLVIAGLIFVVEGLPRLYRLVFSPRLDGGQGNPGAMQGHVLSMGEPMPICPYCRSGEFRNTWGGRGNAQCARCERDFVLVFRDGGMVGEEIPEDYDLYDWVDFL